MIESTIRERENEITVNQLRMAAAAGSGADTGFAVDGVDYGLSGSPAGGKGSAPAVAAAPTAAQFAEGIATAATIPKWEITDGHAGGSGGGEGALCRMRVGRG